MTHTPGPWKRDGLKVIASTRGTICVCPVVPLGGVFNVDANVDLIAAAPDLVAALEAIKKGRVAQLRWAKEHTKNFDKKLSDSALQYFVAEQALAKVGE